MSKVTPPNPYPFIHRSDEQQGVFRCEHREAVGTFKVKHLTVRDLSEIEMLRSSLLGGSFYQSAADLAMRQAWVALGFEKKPEGFDVGKLRSEALLHALFVEVKSFHDLFREPALETALSDASGDVA